MQRRLPAWMKNRPEPEPRQQPRSFCVRRFTPESNEHIETADGAPADVLLVVSKDAPEKEVARGEALAKAKAGLDAAKAREAELAGAESRDTVVAAESATAESATAESAGVVALSASATRDEIAKAKAEQERFTAEIGLHSRPLTTTISFMFRRCDRKSGGELSDDARLVAAMLVPGEGDPVPLQFEGGNAGSSVTMTAKVELSTTFYVALQLVGLVGVEVEVVLLHGGVIMSGS